MRKPRSIVFGAILAVGLLSLLAGLAYAQLWHQFAHPTQPHPGTNVNISIPDLVNNPNAVVQRPVLVVLMEFTDVTHEADHNVAFFDDLFFGQNRPDGRPSVAEIVRENSNGRFLMVPATTGDQDGNQDGIVGWATASNQAGCCRQTNATRDPIKLSSSACQAQGYTWTAGSSAYYLCWIKEKRAEAVRVADPFFNYSLYDTNSDDLITVDELTVVLINADDTACDQHIGHPNLPGCTNQAGGNVRATDPSPVPVEAGQLDVSQAMAGLIEQAHVGVAAHELGHQTLGLADLYEATPNVHVADGYLLNGTDWHPPPPHVYSMMDRYPPDRIPHLDPWAKIHLGFVEPLVVTHDGPYTLYDAETERSFSTQDTQPEAMIIYDPLRSDPYKEYFILENRNQTGLPDQGLAVWLIDENGASWPSDLNLRKVIRLIRRDGYWASPNDALWDGSDETQGYDLTATSTPRNTSWSDGAASYIEIYDISVAGPSMTFKVRMPPIFVDEATPWSIEDGSQQSPYDTVGEAIAAIPEHPRTIRIAGGSYPETMVINSPLTLMGWKNGDVVIGQ